MKIWVLRNPNPQTRAFVRYEATPGYEETEEADFIAWRDAQPPIEESQQPWRVSKDTIISRVLAAGKLSQVMAALANQPPEQQFLWNNSLWFWNTNATLRGLCTALDMDPDEILARDPYL